MVDSSMVDSSMVDSSSATAKVDAGAGPDAGMTRTLCSGDYEPGSFGALYCPGPYPSDEGCPATEPALGSACPEEATECYYCPAEPGVADGDLDFLWCDDGAWNQGTFGCAL